MKHILIVDDAATVRMFHRQILESAGYQVSEAINGIEALEKALTQHYDLFVVDVNMPKMDGYSFLRELRSQDIEQAPALMVSTEAADGDMLLAFEAGANMYMTKPIKPVDFLEHIRLCLGEEAS